MNNKATLLNILLALIILVLVWQLHWGTPPQTAQNKTTESAALDQRSDTLPRQGKQSVGVKGHIMPKPALVIASYSEEGVPNMMTAAWAGIVNSEPLSIGVSIRPSRKSFENILASKSFTINVPSAKYVAHMDYVGVFSGHDENKFEKLGLTPVRSEHVHAPYIGEFPIVIECELTDTFHLGTHVQFIGKVIDTKVDGHLLQADGKVNIKDLQALIYEEDYYYGYGQPIAKPWDAYKAFVEGEEPERVEPGTDNHTLAVIHERKSVRSYTDQQVSDAQLKELTRAAMAAPTAVDKRPWSFVIVNERKLLDSLAEILPYGKMLREATGAIAVCGDMNKALPDIAQDFWIQDCSAATQNILLAAESMGLGAVWIGGYPIPERVQDLRSMLQLPEHIIPLNIISIGYPKGPQQAKNKWDESIIHFNSWGKDPK